MLNKLFLSSAHLFFLKLLTVASPFLLLPFLIRSYEPLNVSKLFLYQSIALISSLIVEYGFNLTATKTVAAKSKISEKLACFYEVIFAKLFLLFPMAVVLIILCFLIPAQYYDLKFTLITFCLAFSLGFSPTWFFHGLRRTELAMKLEGTIVICNFLICVGIVHLSLNVFYILMSQVVIRTFFYSKVYNKYYKFYKRFFYGKSPTAALIKQLKEGLSVFIFRLTSSLYTRTSTILVSNFSDANTVISFSTSEKISKGSTGVMSPFSQALFPNMSYLLAKDLNKAKAVFIKSAFILTILATFLTITLFCFSEPIITTFLGHEDNTAVELLKIMSLLPIVITFSNLFGVQLLLNLNEEKIFTKVIIFASVLHISIVFFVLREFGPIGLAYQIVFLETLIALLMLSITFTHTDFWKNDYGKKDTNILP